MPSTIPNTVASTNPATVSIVVGIACWNRIAWLVDSTCQTAEGGASRTGEILPNRQISSQAPIAHSAKPSGNSTVRPQPRPPPASVPLPGPPPGPTAPCSATATMLPDVFRELGDATAHG